MSFIVKPSRPGSRVAAAYALQALEDRAAKKAARKPAEPEPTSAPKRKKGGR
jgi:hypothetical protein